MSEPKRIGLFQGSLFAAVLDTGIAIWCFVSAMKHPARIELWVLSVFFGILATWEWHAYLHKDETSKDKTLGE